MLEASIGAGTSEEVYQSVFNQRSYPHMRAVFEAFKELAEGKDIDETIESEFSGSLQTAYLALGIFIAYPLDLKNLFRNLKFKIT